MTQRTRARARRVLPLCLATGVVCLFASAAAAQGSVDPNPGAVTLTGAFDVANAYFFRGIPQDDTGVVMWPSAELGFTLRSGGSGLRSVTASLGTWNSLHTGVTGSDGIGKLWFESDFYATLALGIGGGVTIGTTYTAYTNPSGLSRAVRELGVKVALDGSSALGRIAARPYALVAFELDGQADAGPAGHEGTYLEIGAAPSFARGRMTVTAPVKVGLSLRDYYEGLNGDETFGFFSVAGVVTVPFSSMPTRVGTWDVHGGVEFLRLGDRNQAFGETHVIGSIGIGLSY